MPTLSLLGYSSNVLLTYHMYVLLASGKKICVQTHRWRPDASGARDALEALDAPWHGTYRCQREMHRQCEFGLSSQWHRASGCCSPRHYASGRSSPWHQFNGWRVSGHFPSGHSCVSAFSFLTQPCQGKWRLDDACHGTAVTLAVKAQNIAANTLVAFANTQRVPGIVTQSSSIHYI